VKIVVRREEAFVRSFGSLVKPSLIEESGVLDENSKLEQC